VRLVRKHELQRRDDVRCRAQQDLPLGERFGNQPELVVLEVAQPAVNELRAVRRGMRCEVVLLDQDDAQPAAGSVARDACAVDPAADDGEVVNRCA
jgi:hypothetical protein